MQKLSKSEMNVKSLPMVEEEKKKCLNIITKLKKLDGDGIFHLPVDYKIYYPNYPDLIKHPMDLKTAENKVKKNKYTNTEEFLKDINLIWENCKTFNTEDSDVYNEAVRLQKETNKLISTIFKEEKINTNRSEVVSSSNEGFANNRNKRERKEKTENIPESQAFSEKNLSSENQSIHSSTDSQYVTITDKMKIHTIVMELNEDALRNLVTFLFENVRDVVEDFNDTKIHVRLDILTKSAYEKVLKKLEDICPESTTNSRENKDQDDKEDYEDKTGNKNTKSQPKKNKKQRQSAH